MCGGLYIPFDSYALGWRSLHNIGSTSGTDKCTVYQTLQHSCVPTVGRVGGLIVYLLSDGRVALSISAVVLMLGASQ